MRRLVAPIAAALCACGGSAPQPSGCAAASLQDAFGGLRFVQPLLLLQAPGDAARFFVVEKRGTIRSVSGSTVSTVLDLSDKVNSGPPEAGMLGLAFHPDWQTNHLAFVSYTAHSQAAPPDCRSSPVDLCSTLSRISSSDGGATLDRTTEQPILTVEQPFPNHNGGNVVIGPDRLLYFGLGDGGSSGDPLGNAQNLGVILGKLLRLDPDTGAAPATNPFVSDPAARHEIFAYGLRNPWRFSFDRQTGQLWIADVGQDAWEEVDIGRAGANYGWPIREGFHCYNASTCAGGFTDPIVEYGHDVGISITGGFVYRGFAVPQLFGKYLYGDFGSGRIWAVPAEGPYTPVQIARGESISSFGEDAAGELYVVQLSGAVRKIVSACP